MIVDKLNLIEEINRLKKEKNAIILAHFYQNPEIQEIADFIGDSLGLSQNASTTNADTIIFAGVNFMAETAKILNPNKRVFIPDLNAGCSLADSCPKEKFEEFVKNNPEHIVITYINCSSDIKTLSDVICTSSNAIAIVESFPKDQKIIFAPDKNLGNYINNKTGRNMLLWDGSCMVHETYSLEQIINLKIENPALKLIAHPECKSQILELADYIGSTTALLNFTKNSSDKKFIVATESGIIYQMKKYSPEKEFLSAPTNDVECACNDCKYMKLTTLEKIYMCLNEEINEVFVDKDIIEKAVKPIKRMLEISQKFKII